LRAVIKMLVLSFAWCNRGCWGAGQLAFTDTRYRSSTVLSAVRSDHQGPLREQWDVCDR